MHIADLKQVLGEGRTVLGNYFANKEEVMLILTFPEYQSEISSKEKELRSRICVETDF